MEILCSYIEWWIKASGLVAIIIAALRLGLGTYLSKSIEFRIELDKDKKLEDYKTAELIRLKADMIADLIVEFSKKNPDINKLNKLAFEASLWLPKQLVEMMALLLTNNSDAPDFKIILAEVRVHLLGEQERINVDSFVHFPDPRENNLR